MWCIPCAVNEAPTRAYCWQRQWSAERRVGRFRSRTAGFACPLAQLLCSAHLEEPSEPWVVCYCGRPQVSSAGSPAGSYEFADHRADAEQSRGVGASSCRGALTGRCRFSCHPAARSAGGDRRLNTCVLLQSWLARVHHHRQLSRISLHKRDLRAMAALGSTCASCRHCQIGQDAAHQRRCNSDPSWRWVRARQRAKCAGGGTLRQAGGTQAVPPRQRSEGKQWAAQRPGQGKGRATAATRLAQGVMGGNVGEEPPLLHTLLSGPYRTRAGGASGAPSLLVSGSPSAQGAGPAAGHHSSYAQGCLCGYRLVSRYFALPRSRQHAGALGRPLLP